MATPSPICEVKDGSGSWGSTTDGVDVTVGNTISIRLASTTGVDVWSIQCISTDETSTAPALTVNYTTKVATFTAPAAGKALRFKSTVTSQSDKLTSSATFCIYTLTEGGYRVVAYQETTEGDSSFGWVSSLNSCLRTLPVSKITYDTYANRPASPAQGDMHCVTDGPVDFIYSGSAWKPLVGPGKKPHTQPPAASNWTNVGSSTATIGDEYGTLLVTSTNANGLFTYNTGVGSEFTAEVVFQSQWVKQGGGFEPVFALAHYQSSDGKFTRYGWYIDSSGNFTMQVQRFTNRTTAGSVITSSTDNYRMSQTGHNYLRLRQDSTNIYYEFSVDGYRWITYYSEAKATYVTATNVGFFSSNVNASTFRTQVLGFSLT